MFNIENLADELSRTAKLFVDAGDVQSIEEAYELLGRYRLGVRVGDDIAFSPTLQAALLTIVNTARRCFLGGVEVAGCPDAELLIHWNGCRTIAEAVADLKGILVDTANTDAPEIVLGNAVPSTSSVNVLRATFDGWIGGVAPAADNIRLGEIQEFTPSGVLAGSLAVSELFQFVRGKNAMAGKRSVGLSLWNPNGKSDWTILTDKGPELEYLPSRLWLIGLGHLGQAYLWTFGMLPFANPEEVTIVLQDTDILSKANDSTSPLTSTNLVDRHKTRAMADWCEACGFKTRIVERLFADDFKVAADEPLVALCGVDNAMARAALEKVGFTRVIEAGLGRGTEEYLAFQMHHFPASKPARDIWRAKRANASPPPDLAAYTDLADRGLDDCGLTMLANRAVGASFVGTFVSTLVIAEVLRMLSGGASFDVIDGTLRTPESIEPIEKVAKLSPFNPGITSAKPVLRKEFVEDLEPAYLPEEICV